MNFNFINQQHTATHGKCVSNYSGGTKSCAGCGVSAPSNSALECQNCTMIFVKVVKVKSIVDLRGKGTKRCPDPACNEPAKSNRALKCKRCKTPFVIKASKRKATATFAKKNKKAKVCLMEPVVENEPLIVENMFSGVVEPVALSRNSSLQEMTSLDSGTFDFDTFDFGTFDFDDISDESISDAFIDEMTSAFTEEPCEEPYKPVYRVPVTVV